MAVLAALALPASAPAATVGSAVVNPPEYVDYCGDQHEIRYEGRPGERNDAQFTFVQDIDFPALTPGPICWQVTSDVLIVSDLTAPLTASGICRNAGRQLVNCSANLIVGLVINTYDRRDLVKVGRGNPPAAVSAGDGDDAVNTANGSGADRISCGAGKDGATGDPGDQIASDCEKVTRLG